MYDITGNSTDRKLNKQFVKYAPKLIYYHVKRGYE